MFLKYNEYLKRLLTFLDQATPHNINTPSTQAPSGLHLQEGAASSLGYYLSYLQKTAPGTRGQFRYPGQFHSPAATRPELSRVWSGTHLQHLGVIEGLVLVAALADGKDALREIGAFVQDQH